MYERDDLHSPDEFDPVSPRCHCGAALAVRCTDRGCHGETCDDCELCGPCLRDAEAAAMAAFLVFAGLPACASCGHYAAHHCESCDAPLCEDDCGRFSHEAGWFCSLYAETPCGRAQMAEARSYERAYRLQPSALDREIEAEGMALRTGWAERAIDAADLARKADA